MARPHHQLLFTLDWSDAALQELVVVARSDHFSGVISLYVAPGELPDLAERLSGFPTSHADQREFTLGQTNIPSLGQIQVTFSCRDSTGHVGVHIKMFCAPSDPSDKPESCAIFLVVVPSDIDRFVNELRLLDEEGQTATLENAA
ncbi:hypothetical protein [Niveibacterium microcysteis]|uniref:Uncharacterized protein n=1 Tax=Niveibacterium microcysteis TaxID=2811415 RepID=A0ABX7MCG3_9RHOO|nr:hypothetical protein [Niveibacterium microcysteis]QSI78205.1 hypothetical protein JY500_06090 [Niveibacterium microcysteis]